LCVALIFGGTALAGTVDQIMEADAQAALATEQAKAAKAMAEAAKAAGKTEESVKPAQPLKVVHPEPSYELESIYGLSGGRQVRLKMDGLSVTLMEPGGENSGLRLVSIAGTCATVEKIVRSASGKARRKVAKASSPKPRSVCYAPPVMPASLDRSALGSASLPPPTPLGALPSFAGMGGAPVPSPLPSVGGSLPPVPGR
jgi:hypothetical protein